MYAIVLLMGAINHGPAVENTEVVEINYCYNRDTGEQRFVQVIYWGSSNSPFLHVREWHMLDKCQNIYRVAGRSRYPITVMRKVDSKIKIIRAKRLKITHTYKDPEEEDRKRLPVRARRPIGK